MHLPLTHETGQHSITRTTNFFTHARPAII